MLLDVSLGGPLPYVIPLTSQARVIADRYLSVSLAEEHTSSGT